MKAGAKLLVLRQWSQSKRMQLMKMDGDDPLEMQGWLALLGRRGIPRKLGMTRQG